MPKRPTRMAFALIATLALLAAVFRVATAPERVRDRRDTAHDVCLASGGEWAVVEGDEVCRRASTTGRS